MGEPMLELNQRRPAADAMTGGETLYLQGHGGDTSNAAVAAARNGASAGYLTALGRDAPPASLPAVAPPRRGGGGGAAGGAARDGASAGYGTAMGRDAPGESLLALWAREGVDTATVARHE